MTLQQKKVLALGLGFVAGGVIAIPILRRMEAKHRKIMDELERERNNIWVAAGIVGERARLGRYRTHEEADTDFEFERIRLMEEEPIDD